MGVYLSFCCEGQISTEVFVYRRVLHWRRKKGADRILREWGSISIWIQNMITLHLFSPFFNRQRELENLFGKEALTSQYSGVTHNTRHFYCSTTTGYKFCWHNSIGRVSGSMQEKSVQHPECKIDMFTQIKLIRSKGMWAKTRKCKPFISEPPLTNPLYPPKNVKLQELRKVSVSVPECFYILFSETLCLKHFASKILFASWNQNRSSFFFSQKESFRGVKANE